MSIKIEFKNAKYFKDVYSNSTEPVVIQIEINGIISSVPLDLGHTDYAEIMKQVDAGELTIEPADE